MEQAKIPDKRIVRDRRMRGASSHTGPERRSLKYRRSGEAAVCIYCGEVCGDSKGWNQGDSTIETSVEYRGGICTDCSSKRFPQFYTHD
jgi:hypothetical protein